MILYMYIALGQGQTTQQVLMSTGRPLWLFVAISKTLLQPLTLYISFHDLINVYSRRSGADNPKGTKF